MAGGKLWTDEEKNKFESLYKDGLSFYDISVILNRKIGALNAMSARLELDKKYTRTNSSNFKYARFNKADSEIIDKIILKNIPNNLDVIKYKIIERGVA